MVLKVESSRTKQSEHLEAPGGFSTGVNPLFFLAFLSTHPLGHVSGGKKSIFKQLEQHLVTQTLLNTHFSQFVR